VAQGHIEVAGKHRFLAGGKEHASVERPHAERLRHARRLVRQVPTVEVRKVAQIQVDLPLQRAQSQGLARVPQGGLQVLQARAEGPRQPGVHRFRGREMRSVRQRRLANLAGVHGHGRAFGHRVEQLELHAGHAGVGLRVIRPPAEHLVEFLGHGLECRCASRLFQRSAFLT